MNEELQKQLEEDLDDLDIWEDEGVLEDLYKFKSDLYKFKSLVKLCGGNREQIAASEQLSKRIEEEFDSLNDDLYRTANELNDARREIDWLEEEISYLKEDVDWLKEDVDWLKEENEWLKEQYGADVDYISYLLRLKTPYLNRIVDWVVKKFRKFKK